MPKITKASFARAKSALGIKKVTKKNIGRIAKKASGGGKSRVKSTKGNKKQTGSKRKLTRRKNWGKRKKKQFTLPLAPIIGLGVGLAGPIKDIMDGEVEYAMNKLKYSYLGLMPDNTFKPEALMSGLVPLIVGGLVHKFVGGAPLNLNRMLASANVPVIRI